MSIRDRIGKFMQMEVDNLIVGLIRSVGLRLASFGLVATVELTSQDAKMPEYGSEMAHAFDLFSPEDVVLYPGESKAVNLRLKMKLPHGWGLVFWSKSGLAVKGLEKGAGLIDSDYRGELIAIVRNENKPAIMTPSGPATYQGDSASKGTFAPIIIEKGQKLVQAFLLPRFMTKFVQGVVSADDTERGTGGFGSTGV